MKSIYIKDLNFTPLPDEICAAIGSFDGVHLGHQKLIEECKKHGYKSAVLTFYPHPSVFLKKIPNYPLLTPLETKAEIISKLNIDYFIVVEFNDIFASVSKGDFIKYLKNLNIKACVCGYDFTFGKRAEGNIKDLAEAFEFYEVKKFVYDEVRVSSTYIRELISIGNIKKANELLGRIYSINGKVSYGHQKGRLIGFPTANVDYKNYYLPKSGVYFVKVKIDDKMYIGMCNIGHNPTFNFTMERTMEVNVFDFDDDIYDEQIVVYFIDKIRDEKKYSSVDELVNQLKTDKNKCIELAKSE